MLDNTQNKASKFRIRNLVEINDESLGTYDKSNQIKFKTLMIKSNLDEFSGTITITGAGGNDDGKQEDERNNGVIFRNSALLTYCVCSINNIQIDNAKDIDVLMSIYNLTEYSDNYLKTSGSLWQYYRDEPSDETANSESLSSKIKMTGKNPLLVIQKMLK